MGPPGDQGQSRWQRFLSGKTGAQHVVLAVGTLAGAVLAIGGLIAGVVALVDSDDEPRAGSAGEGVQTIANQSSIADDFVEFLLAAAGEAPVQLDHQVVAPRVDGGAVRLEYNCAASGCNFVRLETPADIPAEIADGVWYQGCWSVTRDGAGYAADYLDLELRRQGDDLLAVGSKRPQWSEKSLSPR